MALYSTHRHKDNKVMTFGVENVADFEPGSRLFVYLSLPGVHSKISSCAKHLDQYPGSSEFMEVFHKDKLAKELVQMEGKFGFLVPLDAGLGAGDPLRYDLFNIADGTY